MNSKIIRNLTTASSIAGALILHPSAAHASGFEKAALWSAHWSSLGGAASSSVMGPEALYFNPAGLAGTTGLMTNINGSATWAQFKTPVVPGQGQMTSNTQFILPYAAFVSYGVTPKFAVGAGVYIGGGSRAEYTNIDWSSLNANLSSFKTTDKANLAMTEISIGAGYEVLDGLKIGLGYRILMGKLDLQYSGASPMAGSYALAQYNLNGMSGTRYNGFRAGIQYAPKEARYGLGVEWRSKVTFNLTTSDANMNFLTPAGGTPVTLSTGGANLTNTAPQNVSIGGHYDLIPKEWRFMTEYTFTQYHDNQSLQVQSTTTNGLSFTDIYQGWSNMNNLRFGTEYKALGDLALRAGYIWTSQVVPNSAANPLFASPGTGNTAVIGLGKALMPDLVINGALEYSWAKGSVASSDKPIFSTQTGDYNARAYVIHFDATYALPL